MASSFNVPNSCARYAERSGQDILSGPYSLSPLLNEEADAAFDSFPRFVHGDNSILEEKLMLVKCYVGKT